MLTTIEEASPPRDRKKRRIQAEKAELVPALLSIAKSVRTWSGIALTGTGVVAGQDSFLLALGDGKPMSVRAVAEALSVRPSTVSKMVDILERKRMVSRSIDPTDARHVMITLTPEGTATRRRVAKVHATMEAELIRHLHGGESDVMTALRLLDDVLAARLRRLR